MRKDSGLVRDVFQQKHMLKLRGNVGIGHVRYPTAGSDGVLDAQPFYVNSPYGICLGHNGNLTNARELAEVLVREDRRHLNTSSDSEVLLNVLASELQRVGTPRVTAADIFAAVTAAYRRCRGGYAVVAMVIGHGNWASSSCAPSRRARPCSSTSRVASTRKAASRSCATRRASSSTSISRGPTRSSTTSRCTRRACGWATGSPRRSGASGRTTTSTS
jgi:glutamine phosphoribosylpyrophosphate amidotransferase